MRTAYAGKLRRAAKYEGPRGKGFGSYEHNRAEADAKAEELKQKKRATWDVWDAGDGDYKIPIVGLEDDKDELRRRVYAAMLKYGIKPAEVKGWLFLVAPKGLKLAEMSEGSPQASALEELIRAEVTTRKLDIVSLDPFVKSHGLDENSNNAMDYVCGLLVTIADDLNCAIDFPHHTNKGIAAPGDANKGRGASSTKDAARLVYTVTPMTTEEAQQFTLSEAERRMLIRMDSGKVNIAPPATEARWFRLISVALDNATDHYPAGDHVQTVEPWHPPDTWKGLDSPLLNRILDAIDTGLDDGERYSAAAAAGKRAAWPVVQAHSPDKTEQQCRAVVKAWVKSGTLFAEDYTNHDSKTRKGLRVNHNKRPS